MVKGKKGQKETDTGTFEEFTKLQSRLKALLNRALPRSKSSHATSKTSLPVSSSSSTTTTTTSTSTSKPPPDEDSLALGKQMGYIYASLYFLANKHDKLKSKWREEGYDLMDSFTTNDTNNNSNSNSSNINDAVICAFFNHFVNEISNQLLQNDKNDNNNDPTNDNNIIMDDISYWWVSIITRCEKATANNNNNSNNIAVSSSIRGYVKFADDAYTRIINNNNNDEDEDEDNLQLSRLYHKLTSDQYQQCLIRELVPILFRQQQQTHQQIEHQHQPFLHLNFITPLLNKIIINSTSSSASTSTSATNLSLFFSLIMHECSNSYSSVSMTYNHTTSNNDTSTTKVGVLLPWLIQLMNTLYKYSSSSSNSSSSNTGIDKLSDIVHDFSCKLCDCIISTIQQTRLGGLLLLEQQQQQQQQQQLRNTNWLGLGKMTRDFMFIVLNNGFSTYSNHSSTKSTSLISIQPLMKRMNHLMILCNQNKISIHDDDDDSNKKKKNTISKNISLYQCTMMILLLQNEDDIMLLLEFVSNLLHWYLDDDKTNDDGHVNNNNNGNDNNPTATSTTITKMTWAALYCIGHIFVSTPAWNYNTHANNIIHIATQHLRIDDNTIDDDDNDSKEEEGKSKFDEDDYYSNFPYSSKHHSNHEIYYKASSSTAQKLALISSLTQKVKVSSHATTTAKQCEMILLGLSLFVTTRFSSNERICSGGIVNENDDPNELNDTVIYSFLNTLLQELPHLGRRSLLILKVIINHDISQTESNKNVEQILIFICNSVARDASCAHEIWRMLSSMIDPSSSPSIKVQCMVIRLYPLLRQTNRRLYGRIIESLGTYVSHPNAELRVITASTICELAKKDLITDVNDVIGWIQSFLVDEETMIIYFAILSLHHLVFANELEYVIVLKVLNKKLVKLDDSITEILGLDDIVIEALVQFLGNGETVDDDDDSSESSDEDEEAEKVVPPHTLLSISSLCNLALDEGYLPSVIENQSPGIGKLRILSEIYESLSQYSNESFDIDEDLICVDGDNEENKNNRYYHLKRVIDGGNQLFASCDYFSSSKRFEATIMKLTLKLEEIENESPVSARWIQQQKNRR